MDYDGPETADLADIADLNRAFLRRLRSTPEPRDSLPGAAAERIAALTDGQLGRLATIPLLLASLRERDTEFWAGLAASGRTRDLFAAEPEPDRHAGLGAATLAFVWQLARRDPHAARLVCAAPRGWCEQLVELPLVGLLDTLTVTPDIIVPRLAGHAGFWSHLVRNGIHTDASVRRMAHLTAVQVALTQPEAMQGDRLAQAACRIGSANRIRRNKT